jgi:hypothetical protein
MTQPPDDHIKALWQGQETETKPMSVEAIRARAARFATWRRLAILFGFTLMLAEIVVFGRYILIIPDPGARIGFIAILVGLGWMIARYSLLLPRRFPNAKASGESILEFHRTELERTRATFGSMLVMAGPMLLGVIIFVIAVAITHPHRSFLNAAPVLALMGLWLVSAWWLARWTEKKRLRKLAEIEATRVEGD